MAPCNGYTLYLRAGVFIVFFFLFAQYTASSNAQEIKAHKEEYECFLKGYIGKKIEVVTIDNSVYNARLAGVKEDVLILEIKRTEYMRLNITDVKTLELQRGSRIGSVLKHSVAIFGIIGLTFMFVLSAS